MSMRLLGCGLILALGGGVWGCGSGEGQAAFPVLKGEYLGQAPPGAEPALFAPGIINTGMFTRDITMTPDGREIYYCITAPRGQFGVIMVTHEGPAGWSRPEVAPFSGNPDYVDIEPFITPDGEQFYFVSTRPASGTGEAIKADIYVMARTADGWGPPRNLGSPINTELGEYFPSVTRDGTLYFSRTLADGRNLLFRSQLHEGAYAEPEQLPEQVNSGRAQFNAYIAPDESYLIVPVWGRDDSMGQTDYYVCFRNPDDTWMDPIQLGDRINTAGGGEYSPYVSPDGRFFFFMSSRGWFDSPDCPSVLTYDFLQRIQSGPENGNASIYWISADFIRALKPSS